MVSRVGPHKETQEGLGKTKLIILTGARNKRLAMRQAGTHVTWAPGEAPLLAGRQNRGKGEPRSQPLLVSAFLQERQGRPGKQDELAGMITGGSKLQWALRAGAKLPVWDG